MASKSQTKEVVYTIGHSTRTIEEFIGLLEAYQIEGVVDVRTIPKSRHNPQFNEETLALSLEKAGIKYMQITELGGLRHTHASSKNLGWRNLSFRGYADYMETSGFESGIEHLKEIAKNKRIVIMCAEAVPWRCHRSLIGDALLKQHWHVYDIMSLKTATEHRLTPFLKMEHRKITYPEIKE